MNCKRVFNFKGTLSVFSSDHSCNDDNPRFSTVSVKPCSVSLIVFLGSKVFYSDNSYKFFCSRNAQLSLFFRETTIENYLKTLIILFILNQTELSRHIRHSNICTECHLTLYFFHDPWFSRNKLFQRLRKKEEMKIKMRPLRVKIRKPYRPQYKDTGMGEGR